MNRLKYGVENVRAFDSRWDQLRSTLADRPRSGLVLEFGVYKAASLNFIAAQPSVDSVFGFDSFEGLPQDWRRGFEKGMFSTSPPSVLSNAVLVEGWFEDSIPRFLDVHQEAISFIHMDCDLYSSTQTALTHCNDRIVPGTVLVFDEFHNYQDWVYHEYKAFIEYAFCFGRTFEYVSMVPNSEQVAAIITQ